MFCFLRYDRADLIIVEVISYKLLFFLQECWKEKIRFNWSTILEGISYHKLYPTISNQEKELTSSSIKTFISSINL